MRRLISALAVCVAATACSDNDPTEPGGPVIEGAYTLQTINGQLLPFLLIDIVGLYRLHQVSGSMTLNANRTFVEQSLLRETIDTGNGVVTADTTVVLNGTWVAEDSVVILTTQRDNSVLFGFVSRTGKLTLSFEASADSVYTYEYQRN